jgi:WD40 repeat protein
MLLHGMYELILTNVMPRDMSTHVQHSRKSRLVAQARFHSVMGQILGTAEPLPLASLNAMRRHFPMQEDNFDVELVIKSMGSLLSGTSNPDSPIRPLHASFRDFLIDEASSREFFIDLSRVQRDLAFASLRVMEHSPRFNICDLKSSYLPNSEDPGLQERVQKCIPPHLSYSSRSWTLHVRTTSFDKELAKEVKLFFDHERLFFWLELLGLINALSGAVPALLLISQWLKDHSEPKNVSSTAMDVQRFIQVFGGMILHSTPHLYVSALPFSPANSPLSRKLSTQFPNTLRVPSGRDMNWPTVLAVLRGHTSSVTSVSFSPDGTRIVTGSWDWTVQLWDAATGKPVGEPLRGYIDSVNSVSFLPDGTRIVTGSDDHTVRLWSVATGKPVGEPLQGHTDPINSVSFSPDGTRIVTGSCDHTVRLWDAEKGRPVGEPLQGHTDFVTSVSFSPDGTHIVSSSRDRTVRLWDAATGKPISELLVHTGSVNSVSFSPDGTRIVAGLNDNTVRLLRQPLQQCAESCHSAFSDEHRAIASTTTTISNTWNNHFVCFSPNTIHALRNTSELTEGASHNDRSSAPFVLDSDSGWVVGPKHRLLFWVPPGSRYPFYNPATALVMPRGPELDLSRMAHGQHWQKCREEPLC